MDPFLDLNRTTQTVTYPLPGSACGWDDQGENKHAGVSKHYYTAFEINGMKIALLGIHLLARPTEPDRCAEREAQATVLRGLVDSFVAEGYEVLVLGDFNDYDGEVLDINANQPTSRVLSIIKGSDLTTSASFVPQEERWTDWWDQNGNCKVGTYPPPPFSQNLFPKRTHTHPDLCMSLLVLTHPPTHLPHTGRCSPRARYD